MRAQPTVQCALHTVGNMKLFNNHSGSRGLSRFIKGIYWATGPSFCSLTEFCMRLICDRLVGMVVQFNGVAEACV